MDNNGLFSGFGISFGLIWYAFILVAGWKMYVKGGQHGWVSVIPIISTLGALKIIHRPWWWLLLMLIPIVSLVVWVIIASNLAKAFGHGFGMTLLLIFLTPIAFLVLGFGDSQYQLEEDRLFA